MSGCSNYAENLWKKGKCSNCFRSKDQHNVGTKDGVLQNGETTLSKPYHEGLKNRTSQTNGHSSNKGQTASKVSVDGREFILRKSSNSGNICETRDIETKGALPSYQTTRSNASNSPILKQDIDEFESIDKPKPIPRCKPRSSSKNSSFDDDIFEDSTPAKSVNGTENKAIKSNISSPDIHSGNSSKSYSKQIKSDRKFSSKDGDISTMEGEPKDEPISSNNAKDKQAEDLGSTVSVGNDGEYMPMKNNVCQDINLNDSQDVRVESIKISSPSSSKRDDRSDAVKNKNDFIDNTNKQDSGERYNNISEISSSPSNLASEAKNRKESSNSEPYYENQSSVEKDRTNSTSSEKSLSKYPINITSPSDRPESIAFKVQVDIEEIRASSIFEDIIIESSGSSSQSSQSTSTGDVSSETTANAQYMSTITETSTCKDQSMRRHSNPDVTKLVEGPEYTNSSVKPQTKPYKVVDISGVVLVHENGGDNSDTPPLPPKEKDRQKEASGPDHYYYEPPDDIVPDYKKLTPLNTEPPPPPVIVKKDGQGATVPASLKSMPVPRPRSSYSSSTLPRPLPRTAKPGLDVKEHTIRPVSQVVTRPTNTEAPRPPSTSSIPSRKPVTEVSPPNSPTDINVRPSPERKGSNVSLDHKDTTIKPRRSAPPPPVLAVNSSHHGTRSPTPTDPRKESPQTTPTPSREQPSYSKSSTLQYAKSQGRSTIKKALSSWKRLSGRRKNKKKLDISSPVMMSEESDSAETGDDFAVCTSIKERKRASTIEEQPHEQESPKRSTSSESNDGEDNVPLPSCKPGRPYQNFPFSKSHVEKPVKPDRQAKIKPVLQVKPEVKQSLNDQNQGLESPAYLEPCTGDLTLKVEAALANLNDAKILAETLTRVEQEKLGPLPQVPRSRHVHFRFNETSRPVTAVAPTVVSKSKPKYPSKPPSTHDDSRTRSQSLTVKSRGDTLDRSRSSSTQESTMKKRYDKILELHRQTLQDMINSSKEELLPGDTIDISNTRWNDYEVCGPPLSITSPGAVLVPVVVPRIDEALVLMAKVKIPKSVTEDMSHRTAFMQDMATTVSLPFHANVSRTITHFTDHLPADLFGVESPSNFETLVTITDQLPIETVQEFQERTVGEHMELPDEYERKVCILMLQVLSALDHLHQEGLVHRALLPSNLLLLDHGHLIVSNFSHVLQKSGGDTSSSQFHYTKDNIGNTIGGDPNRTPPEIHKSYNDGKIIDFEKCDSFSAGCLIYELLHQANPFAADPSLLTRDYTIQDLPVLTEASRFTWGLTTLASGLLQREPSLRMLPRDALKLLQAFMWGPEDLDETCLEMSASDWLETERAHAVINIARTQAHSAAIGGEEVLENFLKYQYLVNLTEGDVVEGYKALMPTASQA